MIYLWFLCWWYKYKVLHKLKYLMPIFQSLAAPLVLRKDTLIPIKTGYQKVRLSHEKDVLRPIGLSLAASLVLQKDINEPTGKDPISNFPLSCEKDSINTKFSPFSQRFRLSHEKDANRLVISSSSCLMKGSGYLRECCFPDPQLCSQQTKLPMAPLSCQLIPNGSLVTVNEQCNFVDIDCLLTTLLFRPSIPSTYHISSIRHCGYYFFLCSFLCGYYSRVATI